MFSNLPSFPDASGAPRQGPDVRAAQRVADVFPAFLADETLVNHPLEDDLKLGAAPPPPASLGPPPA